MKLSTKYLILAIVTLFGSFITTSDIGAIIGATFIVNSRLEYLIEIQRKRD